MGILKNKNCHLYRVGGVEDHIYIITHIHPMITPALLTKDIKISTSEFIKRDRIFSHFDGWQNGYGAFTYSLNSKDDLIEYVKNQQEHHKVKTFKEEYVELLNEHNIEFDEKYLL